MRSREKNTRHSENPQETAERRRARRITTVVAIVVLIILCLWASAVKCQTPEKIKQSLEQAKAKPVKIDKGFLRPYGPATWISLGVCVGGAAADIVSTGDMYETNRFMRNSEGKLDVKRAWIVSGIACGASFLIEKKWPKYAHLFRFGLGGLRFKSAIGNMRRR